MHNSGESVPWFYLTYLSAKELRYNFWSTFKISLVVAFIVLPLILLSTLGNNFIDYVKEDMENRFDLRKIRAIVGNPSRDRIKPKDMAVLNAREDISFVQPISTRGVQIIMKDGSMEDFEGFATSQGDPTLRRIGLSGPYPKKEDWLILHKDFAKDVAINSETDEISLVVSSTSDSGHRRQYVIPFKIAGTYTRGGGKEIYLPLELMDRFTNWRRGYAVPIWELPGREDQEIALGLIYSKTVRAFPQYKITEREIRNLALAKYSYALIPLEWALDAEAQSQEQQGSIDNHQKKTSHDLQENKKDEEAKSKEAPETVGPINGLRVFRKDKRLMSEHDLQVVKDLLIGAGTAILVSEPHQTSCTLNEKPLKINASTEHDPWKSGLLIRGSWLDQENDRLQMILPASTDFEPRDTFPFETKILAGDQEIPVQIQGICRGPYAFTHPRTVYRLSQIVDGKAVFDSRTGKFGQVSNERSYVAVYIYAAETEQVKSLENYLQKEYNFVTESYGEMIEDIQVTERRLRILIILLAIAGFFAVILSIAGTMEEAVRGKRRLIGLMRTMGILKKGVGYFFLFQALSYGILGIVLACISQVAATWLFLERSWLYKLLKADPGQHLFWPSMTVWGIFALVTIFICIIAGVRPAVNATKFEPGEILSSAE